MTTDFNLISTIMLSSADNHNLISQQLLKLQSLSFWVRLTAENETLFEDFDENNRNSKTLVWN